VVTEIACKWLLYNENAELPLYLWGASLFIDFQFLTPTFSLRFMGGLAGGNAVVTGVVGPW